MAGLRGNAREPRRDAGVGGKIVAAELRAVGVGVERQVGDRIAVTGEPVRVRQPLLHDAERAIAGFKEARQPLRRAHVRALGSGEDRDAHRDRRLVAVLLEAQPLIRLGAIEFFSRQILSALRKMQQHRIRFGEEPSVLEFEERHPADRILSEELRLPRRAVIGVHIDDAERDAEQRQHQPRLVGVPGSLLGIEFEHGAPRSTVTRFLPAPRAASNE